MSVSRETRSGPWKLALGMAISGNVGAFGVEPGLDSMTIVFWRSVVGSAFLLAWCLVTRRLPDHSLTTRRLALTAAGGSCLVLSWAMFFAAIERTSIATTTILFHIQPFFILLIGVVVFRDRVTRDQLLWMGAAFVGLVLASGMGAATGTVNRGWLIGLCLAVLGALCYAVAAVVGKQLGTQRPEVTALCQTVMGIVLFAPFVHVGQPIPTASWGWLIGIGIIHSGIAWVIIYAAYPQVSTPMIAVLSFVYPLVAISIDRCIYGHPLGPAQATGVALIALATLGVRLGWRLLPASATSLIKRRPT